MATVDLATPLLGDFSTQLDVAFGSTFGWIFGHFLIFGGWPKFSFFLVKTGTGGTGTGGRRNRPEPNRTVGFLTLSQFSFLRRAAG